MANEFIVRKGLISSGSVNVSGSVTASYFVGDGSLLTNLPASAIGFNIDTYEFTANGSQNTFNIVESYNINSLVVTVDGLTLNPGDDYTLSSNNLQFVVAPPSESTVLVRVFVNATSEVTGSFSGSFLGSISTATSSSYAQTASVALNGITNGVVNYIPVYTGANTIGTSSIFQSASRHIIIGDVPSLHADTPPLLEVNAGNATAREVAHFHINIDNEAEIAFKNYSTGSNASSIFKIIPDSGTVNENYISLGVNSSTFSDASKIVDGALNAFLVATGSNLFIGNISTDKDLILFNGPEGSAIENARVFISAGGPVGINTNEITVGNEESLFVRGLTNSVNLITAKSSVDNYLQINIKNENDGINASSDVVATADNGNESTNYIDMGINSSQFAGFIGGPNDAYIYSTGKMLHIGNVTPGEHIMFFAGGSDMEADAKLILEPNNLHKMSGSLHVSGAVTASFSGSLIGTATTSSYVLPSGLPTGTVSASSQVDHDATTNFVANEHIDHSTVSVSAGNGLSGGGDITATRTLTLDTGSTHFTGGVTTRVNALGVYSASSQVSYTGLSNTPSGIVSSSTQIPALLPNGTVSASSQVSYTGLSNIPSGIVSASSQVIYTSLSSIPSGIVSASSQVSYTGLSNTPSGIVSSSTQIPALLPNGTVSASSQVSFTSISNRPSGLVSSSTQIPALLPNGTVSASSQVSYTGLSNIPSGIVSASSQVSYTGLSSIPSGIVSSSTQIPALLPAGTVSASSQVSYTGLSNIPSGIVSSSSQINTGSFSGSITSASFATSASYAPPSFIDNLVTVGLPGSDTQYNSIKLAVDSINDASAANTYTVRVYPGIYIEDTITLKPYIAIKGESSTSTIVSASNPSASIFIMADQTMVIDMGIQGSTAPSASAVVYSSPTTPQTNAIAYVENVRFGTNYTNAKVVGSGSSGNCILQCSNVKYGGFTQDNKSFDVGFHVTSGSSGGIGRMQLRNVTSTNGGVAGTDDNQIFALADAPGCTFIVNGCLLTRATGTARGTGFKVYNGGQLRLTGVNFQRWTRGIWAPQTGSAPSIDAIALNFENCTTDVQIDHSGSLGKIQGTDNFLKTIINKDAPLYEVNQDPRKITVAKKGGDFTSISASVAYITDSSENNRYIIEVGPGQFTESEIDLTNKPYVSIIGADIQATEVIASSSNHNVFKLGNTSEISFLTVRGAGTGYAAFDVSNTDGFSLIHKISIYDCDYGIKVTGNVSGSSFFGEYVDINGTFSYGAYISSSNGQFVDANLENYYLFPSGGASIGNYAIGPSASVSLYSSVFDGDSTTNSIAIKLEDGAVLEAAGLDVQEWDYGLVVPNTGAAPEFRIVGSMLHDITTYDFDIQKNTTRGRFQGVSNHTKINNNSPDFYWNFLDDEDGENNVTRKLSVTFADGTHTDATTLIFKGSSMGVLEGGKIVTSSGLTVTAQSGYGYLNDPIDPEVFKRFDWVNGNITLSANSTNYLFIDSTGTLTSASSSPNFAQNIILGRVVTNDTGVEFIDQSGWNAEHTANRLSKFTRQALGPVFAEGSIVTEDAVPFKLDVTAGNYYFAENNFLPAGTSSINLLQYYPSASTWARYTSSVVPNNTYASSSALVAMSPSYYTKHTVYLVGAGVDEKYFLVINSNEYSTLVEAENAALPTTPTYFDDGVVPLAAVYVQSGSANITQIQDIRPIIGFRAAGVNASSTHGNLLGLNADDHPQYLLVNGTRAMSGDLSLGGNDITNVDTMFGTASFAITASYALATAAGSGVTSITAGDGLSGSTITSTGTIALDTGSAHFVTGSRKTISAANTVGASGINTTYNSATGIISSSLVNSSVTVNGQSISLGGSGTVTANTTNALTLGNGLTGTSFNGGSAVTATVDTGSTHFTSGVTTRINALGVFSSSAQVSFTGLSNRPAGLVSSSTQIPALLPNGTVSASSQVVYTSLSSIPSGIVSSSTQIPALLPNGTVSASSQVSYTGLSNIPSGIVSASSQVSYTELSSIPSGIVSSSTQIPALLPNGTVSASSQVVYTSLSSIPSGIVSSSTQIPALLPNGTVSASSQVSYTALSNIPSGIVSASSQVSYTGLSSIPSGIVSSSTQIPALLPNGTVSASSQVSFTAISNRPAGLVSSSTQIPAILPTGTVSASSQVVYTSLSSIPSGIVSSSTQIPALLPAGTVSASSQVVYTSLSSIPAGIVSTSAQIVTGIANQNIAPTILSASIVSASQITGSLKQLSVGTTAPSNPAINDLWVDTN